MWRWRQRRVTVSMGGILPSLGKTTAITVLMYTVHAHAHLYMYIYHTTRVHVTQQHEPNFLFMDTTCTCIRIYIPRAYNQSYSKHLSMCTLNVKVLYNVCVLRI